MDNIRFNIGLLLGIEILILNRRCIAMISKVLIFAKYICVYM